MAPQRAQIPRWCFRLNKKHKIGSLPRRDTLAPDGSPWCFGLPLSGASTPRASHIADEWLRPRIR